MILNLFICLTLLLIVIQDFRHRAVYWLLFPVLLALLAAENLTTTPVKEYLCNSSLNLIIVFIQFTALAGYYVLRGKRLKTIFSEVIGAGDILFIAIMAFAFPGAGFIFFYIAGLLFALVTWLIIKHSFRTVTELVPLAGLLAIFMILINITGLILPGIVNDLTLINMMLAYGR